MYEFQYIKFKYKDDITLVYMDSDSFIYSIKTDDFYKDIKNDVSEQFEASDYPPNHRYDLPLVNKKVLGMMKDEVCGAIIKEFVGLRPKMCCIDIENNCIIRKCQGVKRVVDNKLTLQNFKDCFFRKKILW